ncbi:ATPase P [candidate division MSBL1 archaeon SCGC-AAA259A05]|uniref:ATPase P n=1 Tax=candidate division MSBL1 archaeon SCGC-AAA259A05 TaxID=1698259 RepID=A0A133UC32_9EURY|nr:ATPase P [candidate division MSBL1 archaeon SCGC-AAA259A05]
MGKYRAKVGGMSCSFCTQTIEKAYSRLDGVEEVSASLSHEEVLVKYGPDKVTPQELKQTLLDLGYTVRDPDKVLSFEEQEKELRGEENHLYIAGAFTAFAAALMVAMWFGLMQPWFPYAMLGAALATMFGPGRYIKKMAYNSLKRKILNQHVLLEFGAFAGLTGGFLGFIISDFPVVDFFAVSIFITTYHILFGYSSLAVRTRASQAVKNLMDLQPEKAYIIRDGEEVEVPLDEISVDDMVRVRPGESIPIDGLVEEGYSSVDESLVTGESIPAEKKAGDEVIGGSINKSGSLKIRVTKIGEESFLSQIARHIKEARALKPSIIQLVDKVIKYYVPWVIFMAALGVGVWTLGLWLFAGTLDVPRGIFAALAVLVMGYPCALGMATPLAMIRGGGEAARKGIFMRSGEAFQVFGDIDVMVLDKTGTITIGEPRMVEVQALSDERELLEIASSAEIPSEHPLARAIVEGAKDRGIAMAEPKNFEATHGKGITAKVEGKGVLVGNLRFLEDQDTEIGGLEIAEGMEEKGETVIGVTADKELLGFIGIADVIKDDAAEAVNKLNELGIETIMITGDNEKTAKAVAAKVGIDEVLAEVLPDKKAEKIRDLQNKGQKVAMVGDGINDAPALMQADVGIATGAGTDTAIESADVVLVRDKLTLLIEGYHIGRSSYSKTKQNLTLAFSFNGVGVPASVTGLVHPVWAMIAMVASVSAVLLNSFGGRLIPKSEETIAPREFKLKVPTIHCENCVSTIESEIGEIDGVKSVEVSLSSKEIKVSYRGDELVKERVREKLLELGHAFNG